MKCEVWKRDTIVKIKITVICLLMTFACPVQGRRYAQVKVFKLKLLFEIWPFHSFLTIFISSSKVSWILSVISGSWSHLCLGLFWEYQLFYATTTWLTCISTAYRSFTEIASHRGRFPLVCLVTIGYWQSVYFCNQWYFCYCS